MEIAERFLKDEIINSYVRSIRINPETEVFEIYLTYERENDEI